MLVFRSRDRGRGVQMPKNTDVDTWFCEAIEKVRVVTPAGGDALTVSEAKELRSELSTAIEAAETGQSEVPTEEDQ